jgi:hypothetical protein
MSLRNMVKKVSEGYRHPRTVTRRVDMVRELRNSNLEPRLDSGHNLLVALRRYEGNGEAFCTKTTSTAVADISC